MANIRRIIYKHSKNPMDDANTAPDPFYKEMALRELDRTIRYARLRCLTPTEIISRTCDLDEAENLTDYVGRLAELNLSGADLEYLAKHMTDLARSSERAPSRLKARIDRTLLRLVRILPSQLASKFAEPYVDHPRKARRQWAYTALREKQISPSMASKLVKSFRERGEQEALELIARNPERVPETSPEFLLQNITEKYWRARVLEGLLLHDRPTALSLSQRYPFEFAHAVGRVGDLSLLSPLRTLFEANSQSFEFLGIYAYALGKLGAREEIEALALFVRTNWAP